MTTAEETIMEALNDGLESLEPSASSSSSSSSLDECEKGRRTSFREEEDRYKQQSFAPPKRNRSSIVVQQMVATKEEASDNRFTTRRRHSPSPPASFFCLRLLIIFATATITAQCCTQQYRRELNLLNYYLGIVPANKEGALPIDEKSIDKYVEQVSDLNCDFYSDCLWTNAPSDGLLDTSELYLFKKVDMKTFPIGPGNAAPKVGTNFVFAGNLTNDPQSAVLISAPIACQSSHGVLTFDYWLYNSARVEVVLLKVNPTRRHLQVIERPLTDCHTLKGAGHPCRVEIKRMSQPFRLGIRAHKLRDPAVGSFVMLNNIRYEAELCGFYDRPLVFGGIPTAKWIRQRRPITRAADLNCESTAVVAKCLWSDYSRVPNSAVAHWAIGNNLMHWEKLMKTPTWPYGQFLFQHVDPMAELPLPQLQSALVPCTQTPSSLSFKFWLSAGIQAQVCTVGIDNMPLSCVFLAETDSPGPVMIDVDTADHQPFRFAFSIIRFDRANGGILVLDDLQYTGYLCHEQLPTPPPRILDLTDIFSLQPFSKPQANSFSDTLDCNFETSDCPHWMVDEEEEDEGGNSPLPPQSFRFQHGLIPTGFSLPFWIEPRFLGIAAVSVFDANSTEQQFSILTSQMISCADHSKLALLYFIGGPASLSVCANDRCVSPRRNFGEMSVSLTSAQPFRIRILAERNTSVAYRTPFFRTPKNERIEQPFVIIKQIKAKTPFCKLETPTEQACNALTCNFKDEGLCSYRPLFLSAGDGPFMHSPNAGAVARIAPGMKRAVLRSRTFRLFNPVEIRIEVTLTSFGTRFYICPDEQHQRAVPGGRVEIANCQLLLGPKVEASKAERISIQLDPDVRHFVFVAANDLVAQFGEGEVTISRVEVVDPTSGKRIC